MNSIDMKKGININIIDKPEETIEDILKGIDTRIKKLYDSLPDNTFFIVTSGQANLANCSK